jgi:hypothetical protein
MSEDVVKLNQHELYDLGGKVFSLKELQQAVIDQYQYHKLRNEIKGGQGL